MAKEIKQEEARNLKIEGMPNFETYHIGLVRARKKDWLFCTIHKDKQETINNLKEHWPDWDERIVVSIELPF